MQMKRHAGTKYQNRNHRRPSVQIQDNGNPGRNKCPECERRQLRLSIRRNLEESRHSAFNGKAVHVRQHEVNVCLSEIIKTHPLGQNFAEVEMIVFHMTFLP